MCVSPSGNEKDYEPLADIEDVISILDKITIFGGLSERHVVSLFRILKQVSYSTDEYIFKQGTKPSHIYIIRKGSVKIVADVDQTALELIVLEVGQCFGETSAIGIMPHTASALAMEETELIVLPRDALLSIFHSDKELFGILILNIAREACRRLHESGEILFHYVLDRKTQ